VYYLPDGLENIKTAFSKDDLKELTDIVNVSSFLKVLIISFL